MTYAIVRREPTGLRFVVRQLRDVQEGQTWERYLNGLARADGSHDVYELAAAG